VNIYAHGQRIAREIQGSVIFEHHNPVTGSWVTSLGHSSYRTTNREERDSFGAEIPTSNPYPLMQSYVDLKFGQPLFIEGSDPFDYSGGCTSFGMPISCGDAARSVAGGLGQVNGIAVSQPNPRGPQQATAGSSKIVDETLIQTTHVWLTGYGPGEWRTYRDTVTKVVNVPFAGQAARNAYRRPLTAQEIAQLEDAVKTLLLNETCEKFVAGVLQKLGSKLGVLDIINELKKRPVDWSGAGGFGRRLKPQHSAEAEGAIAYENPHIDVNYKIDPAVKRVPVFIRNYGETLLHEIFHIAGEGASHWKMLVAGYDVAKDMRLPLGRKPANSDPTKGTPDPNEPDGIEFDSYLRKACNNMR
jgi:hypothetical protein